MKKKFTFALVGITVYNLAALFLVSKLYLDPKLADIAQDEAAGVTHIGLLIFLFLYLVGTAVIGAQIYRKILKPDLEERQRLKRSAEESANAEQLRREFVANVSHELKTPLTSISGFIETLQDGAAENPEIRTKFLDIISIETARLKRLIEDLLLLSDIENKRESSDSAQIDVKSAIEETIETLKPIADKKNINIITGFNGKIDIEGNRDRFKQLMLNLIENAIKYSDEKSRVWIKAENKEDGKVQVSVKDEGIGIAEEHIDRLFERFYRIDKSRSKKAGGTGLGLSIVKHIAFLFNAEINVESQVGIGTVFYITFNEYTQKSEEAI